MKSLPRISDIEQSGIWISAQGSGQRPNVVMDWRKAGRLREGRDCVQKLVAFTDRVSNRVWFYKPDSIAREAAKDQAAKVPHSQKMSTRWKALERIEENGETLLREKAAARFLDVSDITLRRWTTNSCPYKDGEACLHTTSRSPGGTEMDYWFLSELEKVKGRRSQHPRKHTGDVYSLDETAKRTGLSRKILRTPARCKELGLERFRQPVAITSTRRGSKNGKKSWQRLIGAVAFTKRSVDKYVENKTPLAIPSGKTTAAKAAKSLGVDRRTINNWCRGKLLVAQQTKFPTTVGLAGSLVVAPHFFTNGVTNNV